MPAVRTVIQGTPTEAGAEVWEKLVLPCFNAIHHLHPSEIAQFYSGLLMAAMGAMAADFGHERALDVVQTLVDSFAGMADELPGSLTQ